MVPAASLFGVILSGCDNKLVLLFLTLTVGVNGFNYAGFNCNHIDIAPNFAGTLMGITNMVANTTGLLTPVLISSIVGATVIIVLQL